MSGLQGDKVWHDFMAIDLCMMIVWQRAGLGIPRFWVRTRPFPQSILHAFLLVVGAELEAVRGRQPVEAERDVGSVAQRVRRRQGRQQGVHPHAATQPQT